MCWSRCAAAGSASRFRAAATAARIASAAEALLAFVGYHGALAAPADDLPHVDRRLVEIARALAHAPATCCCSTSPPPA